MPSTTVVVVVLFSVVFSPLVASASPLSISVRTPSPFLPAPRLDSAAQLPETPGSPVPFALVVDSVPAFAGVLQWPFLHVLLRVIRKIRDQLVSSSHIPPENHRRLMALLCQIFNSFLYL